MKMRAKSGIGIHRRQAQIISVDEENVLWDRKLLGDHTPQSLLDSQIYLFGLHFALRGGIEHRNLRHKNSQIQLKIDISGKKYLEYREDVSKSNQGGLSSRKIRQKVTRAYENAHNPERCIVRLYERYNNLCPPNRPDDGYYLYPLAKPTATCWYSLKKLGHNALHGTIARLCKEADIPGFRTNHSLRATAATRLYDADIDEQLICEKTGHRSDAVRHYKRTSDEQQEKVSRILQGNGEAPEPPRKLSCTSVNSVTKATESAAAAVSAKDSSSISITINLLK
ncbi:transcriptional regulator QRICH1-like [Ptychodera flava]